MILLSLKMMWHDTAKFFAMILAVALAAFLTQNQSSFLVAFLGMAGSQIRDVREADLWVMDRDTESFDQAKPLKDTAVNILRGFEGISWVLPFVKVDTAARTNFGKLSTVTLLGVSEESRIGEPKMIRGDAMEIYERDSAVVDPGGLALLFPGQEFHDGMRVRVYDEWLRIRGVSAASPPFTGFPIIHVSQSTAVRLTRGETRTSTFLIGRFKAGVDQQAIIRNIEDSTGWKAMTRDQFTAASAKFYADQGVPNLFYITITVGLVVGIAFTGQTFLMFVKENARSFTTLKVLGFTHGQLAVLVATQASSVVVLGLAFGTAFAVGTAELATRLPFFRGVYIPWEVAVACSGGIAIVTMLAAGLSFRNVLKLQPAEVFRS